MNIEIIFAAVVCVSGNNKLSALQQTKIASGILIYPIYSHRVWTFTTIQVLFIDLQDFYKIGWNPTKKEYHTAKRALMCGLKEGYGMIQKN